MKFDIKELKEGGVEIALGTGATILGLHATKRLPANYSGWVLLAAGVLGYVMGGKVLRTASIVMASIGAVKALNTLAGGESTGIKGMINKVVPQLNGTGGVPMLGFGNVEQMNENLLGSAFSTNLLGEYNEELEGADLDDLTGFEGEEEMSGFAGLM